MDKSLLEQMPKRMQKLRLNDSGYPVPWFVARIKGKPDFRVVGEGKIPEAVRFKVCWICGDPLGSFKAFVLGPMCAVNLTSSEPPSHKDCAIFAAKACPFLANPERTRRVTDLPEETRGPAGIHLDRNPMVALVWITKDYKLIPAGGGAGFLFRIGEPIKCFWFARGRDATRAEILQSIETGLPHLEKLAIEEGPRAVEHLNKRHAETLKLLPE